MVCPWSKDRTGLTLSNAEGPASLYNVKETTSTSTAVEEASYILDYVMENTTTDNAEVYSTGLIFKGKYYESSEWDATTKKPKAGFAGKKRNIPIRSVIATLQEVEPPLNRCILVLFATTSIR